MKIDRDVLDEINIEWNRLISQSEEIQAGLSFITSEMMMDEEFLLSPLGTSVYDNLQNVKKEYGILKEMLEQMQRILMELLEEYESVYQRHKNNIFRLGEMILHLGNQGE